MFLQSDRLSCPTAPGLLGFSFFPSTLWALELTKHPVLGPVTDHFPLPCARGLPRIRAELGGCSLSQGSHEMCRKSLLSFSCIQIVSLSPLESFLSSSFWKAYLSQHIHTHTHTHTLFLSLTYPPFTGCRGFGREYSLRFGLCRFT